MNYDATAIPAGYDRGRSLSPDVLDLWMDTLSRLVSRSRFETILDLGCGTGRFSDALAVRFGATVIGVDPSQKMIAQTRGKQMRGAVRFVCGAGEAVPLPDEAVDLVFISMAYHHFADPARVAEECRRLGRPEAVMCVRTGTRDRIDAYPYVEFIPETKPLLHQRLPWASQITRTFEAAGFSSVAAEVVVQEIAPTYRAYVERLAAGGDSVLASLSPRELDAGLEAIRRHAACVDPRPVTEPIDLLVFRPHS